ncbi:MAG: small multi-drug export protein [Candidatus Omnitrophica bacterium]|nr:small multi-drug export protein [Candidatus Omnitrophota bacterium]MBU4488782.1 small multi-drug export protein [Candidatus Omnitrophota bacterium]
MLENIMHFLKALPADIVTFIIAALPVAELRVSIPFAYAMGLPWPKIMLISYLGNMIPIIPLLFLLGPVSNALRRFPMWKRFFERLFEKTRKKAELIQKYEAVGLMLFVAIPFPGTGAWTGCIAASLFKIKFRYAFPAIVLGVIIAGILVMTLTYMGFKVADINGVLK